MNYHISTPIAVEPFVRAGDILAFSGKGVVSGVVKCVTGSPVSHIGIVMTAGPGAIMIESTSLNGFTGVTEGSFVERCTAYDGQVWWLPLADRHRAMTHAAQLREWLDAQNLDHYDTWGAIGSALHLHLGRSREWFCSELASAALKHIGVLSVDVDPDQVRPCDLVRMPIYTGDYYQLRGEPSEIL